MQSGAQAYASMQGGIRACTHSGTRALTGSCTLALAHLRAQACAHAGARVWVQVPTAARIRRSVRLAGQCSGAFMPMFVEQDPPGPVIVTVKPA